MSKKVFRQALGLFSLFFIFNFPLFAETVLPKPVAEVVWIKGNFKAITPNQEERLLKPKSVIYQADQLQTEKDSTAQIVFVDGALMTFKPDTTFKINRYNFSGNKSALKSFTDLVQGGFRTITGLIAKKSPDAYEVNTPVATIGVRGTDYSALYQEETLYVRRYAGTPCVTLKKDKNGKMTVQQAVDEVNKNVASQNTVCLSKEKPCAIVRKGKNKIELLDENSCPALLAKKDDVVSAPSPKFKGDSSGKGGLVDHFCIS